MPIARLLFHFAMFAAHMAIIVQEPQRTSRICWPGVERGPDCLDPPRDLELDRLVRTAPSSLTPEQKRLVEKAIQQLGPITRYASSYNTLDR